MTRTLVFLITALLLAGGVRADITSNLVAHWKLDETSGTSAADSAGSYTGTYTNSPTLNQTGAFGSSKAVAFASASSQYVVKAAPINLLNNVGVCTISAWVKNSTAASQTIVNVTTSTSASNNRASLGISGLGAFRINGRAGDAETTQSVTHISATLDGAWHHWAAVINYASDTMVLYKDGTPGTTSGTVSFTATATSATDPQYVYVAALSSALQYANGTIDDVRIYSRALSAADVAELYAYTGAAKFPYWYFHNSGLRRNPFDAFTVQTPLAILKTR